MVLLRIGVVDEGSNLDADSPLNAVEGGGAVVAPGGFLHQAEGSGVVAAAEGSESAFAIDLDRIIGAQRGFQQAMRAPTSDGPAGGGGRGDKGRGLPLRGAGIRFLCPMLF
ncbi:hypothetical protein AAC387_Pa07g1693 [Persea americana]